MIYIMRHYAKVITGNYRGDQWTDDINCHTKTPVKLASLSKASCCMLRRQF